MLGQTMKYFLSLLALVSCFVGCCGSDKKDFYTKLIAEKDKTNPVYPLYLIRVKFDGKEFQFNNQKVPVEHFEITDVDVLSFANDIADLLRKKSHARRSIQLTHESLDFLATAKWVSLNITSNSDAHANAARSLECEILPELQAIFREKLDEAKLKCIEEAVAQFNKINTKTKSNILTTEGKRLLKDILDVNRALDPNQTKNALEKAVNELIRNTLGWQSIPITLNIDGSVSNLNSYNNAEIQGAFYLWLRKAISFENMCFGDFMNIIVDEKTWYLYP